MNRLLRAIHTGPYARSQPHQHREWEFGWYVQGEGTAWIGATSVSVGPGTLVCYPPDIPHHETTTQPFVGTFLLVDALSTAPALIGVREGLDGPAGTMIALLRAHGLGGAASQPLMAQRLFEALLAYLQTRNDPAPCHPLVEELRVRIHAGADDPDFSITQAGSALRLSRDHLRRLFIAQLGTTPIHYLRDLRVARAQELLAMGRSVTQASHEAGFDDPYYFSRVFTQQVGRPPSTWAAEGHAALRSGRRRS